MNKFIKYTTDVILVPCMKEGCLLHNGIISCEYLPDWHTHWPGTSHVEGRRCQPLLFFKLEL